MAAIKIDKFGGEFPRMVDRNLPPGSAKVNLNLIATSDDFRPIEEPTTIAGATVLPNSVKTLYRRQRGTDGNLLSNVTSGWEMFEQPMSIVKGQNPDDTTERTYYSYDGGGTAPFKMDAAGSAASPKKITYPIGVPAPAKPEISVMVAKKFTRADAQAWRDGTFNKEMIKAVRDSIKIDQINGRYSGGKSVAGVKIFSKDGTLGIMSFPGADGKTGRGTYEPWNMMASINKSEAYEEGFGNPQLGGIAYGTDQIGITFPALPAWGILDETKLSGALDAMQTPYQTGAAPDSDKLFICSQKEYIKQELKFLLSVDSYAEAALKRDSLQRAYDEWATAGYTSRIAGGKPKRGENPSPDTTPATVGTPYKDEDPEAFAERLSAWKNKQASCVTAMVKAAAEAVTISHEIEALFVRMYDDIENILITWLNRIPLEKTDKDMTGLVVINSDPVVDVRYYITTFVTAWGEESAPSPPSSRVELDWNDLAVVKQPTVPDGRNITKWRLYRTNSGAASASFQFVAESDIGYTTPTPVTVPDCGLGSGITGYGNPLIWRDIVATWAIYKARGLAEASSKTLDTFADTSKLCVGDSVTMVSAPELTCQNYKVTKTWNGGGWVMQAVPEIDTNTTSLNAFVDGKYGSMLGEVCETVEWLEPPVVDNKRHLQGLTNMPNGITVGFIDNFIAACEPYVPYAWPVKYQIPLDYPIVGLCAFGQSLFVGTRANPYVVSGTDSMSLSARKINVPQSCVSARSMVPYLGGVAYASPDGYCLANETGVEVITAGLFSRADWQALNPSEIIAAVHDGVLYFWCTGKPIEDPTALVVSSAVTAPTCYGLDMQAKKLVRVTPASVTAVYEDVVTDGAYGIVGSELKLLFSGGANARGQWTSGILTLPSQAPLAWIRVLSNFEAGPVTVVLYGDGKIIKWMVGDKSVNAFSFSSIEPQRLPPGRYLEYQIVILSKSRVSSVDLASTTEELKAT